MGLSIFYANVHLCFVLCSVRERSLLQNTQFHAPKRARNCGFNGRSGGSRVPVGGGATFVLAIGNARVWASIDLIQ